MFVMTFSTFCSRFYVIYPTTSWCNIPYSRMKSLESATVCELKQTWSKILTSDHSSFATSRIGTSLSAQDF